MKQTNSSKKGSLPAIKTQGRKSVQFATAARDSLSSEKSAGETTSSGRERSKGADCTLRFVYSQAVERAFRWCFLATDFGPRSAKPSLPPVAIDKLPQLYDDWLSVKRLLVKKEAYLKKQREEQPGGQDARLRYGQFRPYFRRSVTERAPGRRGSVMSQSGGHLPAHLPPPQAATRKDSFHRLPTIGSSHGNFNRLPALLAPAHDTHSVATSVSTLKS